MLHLASEVPMRTRILAAALTLGVFGCAGRMSITATTPELVYIEPGIQVVVDSDVPIFYTDDYYWRYEGNVWYRSHVASGGWTRHGAPPQHLRRIERPQQYVHYRPRDRGPVARDHRSTPPPPVVRDHRTQPPPIVRDRQPPPPDRDRQDRDDDHRGKDKDKDKDKDEHRKGPH